MNSSLRCVVAALAVVAAGYAGSVAAQDSFRTTLVNDRGDVMHCQVSDGRIDSCGYAYRPEDPVQPRPNRCVATDTGRTYCGNSPVQFVVKGEQSNPVCVEGVTWGIDNGNLWVSGGCSAYF